MKIRETLEQGSFLTRAADPRELTTGGFFPPHARLGAAAAPTPCLWPPHPGHSPVG